MTPFPTKFYSVGEFNIWVNEHAPALQDGWVINDHELDCTADRKDAGVFTLLEAFNVLDIVYSINLSAEVRIVPVEGGDT